MEKRNIGSLKVSPLAFGGNVFGWTADEKHRLVCWMRLRMQP